MFKNLWTKIVAILVAVLTSLGIYVYAQSLTAKLTWTNVDTTNRIQVEKSTSPTGTFVIIQTLDPGTATFTESAAGIPGSQVCYRVAYYNTSGVGPYSNVACKTFPLVPTGKVTDLKIE